MGVLNVIWCYFLCVFIIGFTPDLTGQFAIASGKTKQVSPQEQQLIDKIASYRNRIGILTSIQFENDKIRSIYTMGGILGGTAVTGTAFLGYLFTTDLNDDCKGSVARIGDTAALAYGFGALTGAFPGLIAGANYGSNQTQATDEYAQKEIRRLTLELQQLELKLKALKKKNP